MFPQNTHPNEDVWVAFDLETTGLDAASDRIIEIGAVKFQNGRTLDTYQTLINPQRRLPSLISRLTGIEQRELDAAPPLSRQIPSFLTFIGSAPLIAHNAPFDTGFLYNNDIQPNNPVVDTYDLAYIMQPHLPSYSLGDLLRHMNITNAKPHRALQDAIAAKDLFLRLLQDALKLDEFALAEMQRLAQRSNWTLRYLLDGLTTAASRQQHQPSAGVSSTIGINGLDIRQISQRLQAGSPLRQNERTTPIDTKQVTRLLGNKGALSKTLPGFEQRTEQIEMAQAVANAINDNQRLIVEAGTGVGKSLAYLLPAALYALANNKRVVISTNTINLQEQLLKKDVPILVQALSGADGSSAGALRFTQLKGRSNYLCLRRWNALRSNESLSQPEARMLAKTLMWLQSTDSGDRSEINLGRWTAAAPWDRLSAQGAAGCMANEPACFLRASREKAAASHLIIVNHALLMSDITAGGTLIPDYDVLIIDEAHHLEDEATKHLGFDITQASFEDHIQSLSGDSGIPNQAITALRTSSAAASRRETIQQTTTEITELLPRIRQNISPLLEGLNAFAQPAPNRQRAASKYGHQLRITNASRNQGSWTELEASWENADLALGELDRLLRRMTQAVDDLHDANLLNYDTLLADIAAASQANADLRKNLKEFMVTPDESTVYWLTLSARRNELSLHSAPLHVGELLEERLFSQKECVIMTSATLSANQTFDHIIERTGFKDAEELLLGSPFDYPNAAQLCVPRDMPEPNHWAYREALEQAIRDAALAADGRTMALFTSYTALNDTQSGIQGQLSAHGISVLAQGADSTPAQIVRRFTEDPKAVILGTSSFWEGVDLPGDTLQTLIVARLPFSVPTEPVFEARSELYNNSFMEYALPQAILRLRQGFGRLIRTKTDRGVAIILDNRTINRRYGKAFLNSLPPATQRESTLMQLGGIIRRHLV